MDYEGDWILSKGENVKEISNNLEDCPLLREFMRRKTDYDPGYFRAVYCLTESGKLIAMKENKCYEFP